MKGWLKSSRWLKGIGNGFKIKPVVVYCLLAGKEAQMIELRKPKLGNGGVGGGGQKNKNEMGRSGKMRRVGKTKRGREQRIFDKYMRPLILQETAEATGIDLSVLTGQQVDHINGRNAPGFEPL